MSRRASVTALLCLWCLVSTLEAAQWTSTTSLPDGYSDHALVFANGYLYQTGGSSKTYGQSDGTNVFYSAVTNGATGAWKATTLLPAPISDHASVAANGFVYVIGGIDYSAQSGDTVSAAVYYAPANTNGTLGAWQTATALPNPAYFLSACVWSNTIYVAGGTDNENFYSNVYSATIQSNGSLSAWTNLASLPQTIVAQAQAANGVLYVIGGSIQQDTEVSSNVYYSKINADGSLAGWSQTAALPQAAFSLGAVAAGGIVYSIAGWNSVATSNCFSAAVLGGGPLNAWTTAPSLPMAVYAQGTASTGSYIFVSGGLGNTVASSAVYSLALPAPPATPVLTSQGLGTNGYQLGLTSSTNTGFGILASPDLTNWAEIGYGFTGNNGAITFTDTNAANFSQRFYRAYWPLP